MNDNNAAEAVYDALAVLTEDIRHVDWLKQNDPQALRQALTARKTYLQHLGAGTRVLGNSHRMRIGSEIETLDSRLAEVQQILTPKRVVTDEQAEAVRQAIIARYRWWFEGDHDLSPLGRPEDVTIQRDEDGDALISWEAGPDDWAFQVSEGGSTESDRVMIAEANQEFDGNLKADEPTPVTFPEDMRVEPYYSFVLGVYPE